MSSPRAEPASSLRARLHATASSKLAPYGARRSPPTQCLSRTHPRMFGSSCSAFFDLLAGRACKRAAWRAAGSFVMNGSSFSLPKFCLLSSASDTTRPCTSSLHWSPSKGGTLASCSILTSDWWTLYELSKISMTSQQIRSNCHKRVFVNLFNRALWRSTCLIFTIGTGECMVEALVLYELLNLLTKRDFLQNNVSIKRCPMPPPLPARLSKTKRSC